MIAVDRHRSGLAGAAKPSGSSEIVALTGVRGIAALWVVFFHCAIFVPRLELDADLAGTPVIGLGYLAVDLFFVLSGFVLAMTQRERFHVFRPRESVLFFLARMLRLYPLHGITLCLFVLAVLVSPGRQLGEPPYTWSNFALSFLLLQIWFGDHSNAWNTPSWSIAAELVAYAIFPAVFEAVRRVTRAAVAAVLSLLSIGLLASVFAATGSISLDHTWHLGIVRCVFEFSAGVLLYRYAQLLGRDRIHGDISFALGMAIIAGVVLVPAAQLAVPIGFALLILACYAPRGIAVRLLDNPTALFLGRISFSVYLVHFLVLIIGDDAATRLSVREWPMALRWGWLAMQIAVILLFATVTWRWIERPAQRLSHRLRQRLSRRRPVEVGARAIDEAH